MRKAHILLQPRLHSIAWIHHKGLDKGPRLQCIELFAGIALIATVFRDNTMNSMDLELLRRPRSDNLLTCAGWFKALSAICRADPGALTWNGTPCSSWVGAVTDCVLVSALDAPGCISQCSNALVCCVYV